MKLFELPPNPIDQNVIRALSWKQPYASLMLQGKIETRTWDTKYRGLVLICASAKGYDCEVLYSIAGRENYYRINSYLDIENCPQGKAIAVGELTNTWVMQPEDERKCFVEYNAKLFCHEYKNVRAIEPFIWKGTQGWRTINELEKSKIKYL